tara:strand:- start:75 stop:245 length:171 start_codon:yes stop_codon:yes gene_type:complete
VKKINLKNKKLIRWFFWLVLVVLWNYGYPQASPFKDVIVAMALSIIFIFLEKLKNY